MDKKQKITKMLKDIERLLHKMIDEKRDGPFNAFELLMITMDTMITENEIKNSIEKVGNA